jgi:hypothetical protein
MLLKLRSHLRLLLGGGACTRDMVEYGLSVAACIPKASGSQQSSTAELLQRSDAHEWL